MITKTSGNSTLASIPLGLLGSIVVLIWSQNGGICDEKMWSWSNELAFGFKWQDITRMEERYRVKLD